MSLISKYNRYRLIYGQVHLMNSNILLLKERAADIQSQIQSIISNIEQASMNPVPSYPVSDTTTLVADMKERKEGLSIEDLELQTGLSRSTVKRILNDPSRSSLENFLLVATELGMKITVEAKS